MTSQAATPDLDQHNPFAAEPHLPFGLPDHASIREEHYEPAIRAGMAAERSEVAAVLASSEPATIENTLEALERTGRLLHRALVTFYNQLSADATPGLEAIDEAVAADLAAHEDAIAMDPALFARLTELEQRIADGEVAADAADRWLLTSMLTDCRRAGVNLDEAAKEQLRTVNRELTELESEFGRLLLAGEKSSAVLVTDPAELEGLSDDVVAAAAQAATDAGHDGGYLITLVLSTQQPLLASLRSRELRSRIQRAAESRGDGGEFDTRGLVVRIARLRAEHARILGYQHHGAYVAEDGTAATTDAVLGLLRSVAPPAVANARAEAAVLADAEHLGDDFVSSDWAAAEQVVRRRDLAIDDSELRQYLELDHVINDGVFAAATALYGLTFHPRADLVGYHPDVRIWEVREEDGTPVGLFCGDYYTRQSKRGGAWMNTLSDQSHLWGDRPVVVNNLNITKPAPGAPTLLTWDEVITAFHEFGHALHALFSDVKYPSHSGTEVPRDFVEYPSQVNEMWAWNRTILESFARHHATGEPMPAALVDALVASRRFGQGFATTEYLGAALLDQAWHTLPADELPTEAEQVIPFEQAALAAVGLDFALVPPRYRTTYFNHSFGGGYDAAYYAYLWSEVLDADTVEWFTENGGLRRELGETFRRTLLARGGSGDPIGFFRDLRGRGPEVGHLLVRRGLATGGDGLTDGPEALA